VACGPGRGKGKWSSHDSTRYLLPKHVTKFENVIFKNQMQYAMLVQESNAVSCIMVAVVTGLLSIF
jgi:hypothetical protein